MPLDTFEVRISLEKLLILLNRDPRPAELHRPVSDAWRAKARSSKPPARCSATSRKATRSQPVNLLTTGSPTLPRSPPQPAVVDAIVAANRASAQMNEAAKAAKIANTENKWSTAEVDALVAGILASRASASLRHYRELDPRFMKLIVLDAYGVPVAATDKPAHYAPVDEVFWQGVFAQGKGSVYVTEVLFDGQGAASYVGIGIPVLDESSRRFIGAIHALVDVSGLFALLNREQPGRATVNHAGQRGRHRDQRAQRDARHADEVGRIRRGARCARNVAGPAGGIRHRLHARGQADCRFCRYRPDPRAIPT